MLFVALVQTTARKFIMPWLCLEFCDETTQEIDANIEQLNSLKSLINAVSFEKYTLGSNSTLVDNNLTIVNDRILAMNIETYPLLSSYPHYPEFIDWMRELFANPDPFINKCISEAKLNQYSGYNLDFEPTDNISSADASAYANFINTFSVRLHENNFKLSVDIAKWTVNGISIWDYDSIATTNVDTAISMGTYTSNNTAFSIQLNYTLDSFGLTRTGIGLETVNASNESEPLSIENIKYRFDLINLYKIENIAIWKMPIPINWIPFLINFVNS